MCNDALSINISRSPKPLNENTVNTMKANKGRDTRPELILREALRANGMSGYCLHWKIPGRPDICYPGRRLATFVNGCFWHRCPRCDPPIPRNNCDFWVEKFTRNQVRDARVCRELEEQGWKVLVIWECDIRRDLAGAVARVSDLWKNPSRDNSSPKDVRI